ncbi:zinc ion binding [Xylographa vitiligo]|nr:zinc ion binding [Xylographa vitiligo]
MKMMRKAKIKAGDRVLVNGASGGTGTMAVQTAIAPGAEVVGICSGPNAEMVKDLGAVEVIDYRQYPRLEAYLGSEYSRRPFDAVFDTMGVQSLFEQSPKFLKHNGLFINIGAYDGGAWFTLWCWLKNVFLPTILGGIPRRYIMFSTIPDGEAAKQLAKLVEDDKLKVVIDSMYKMEDVLDAYDRLMSHRARGKIIIKIQDNEL